jgi:hypothetical protein
MSQYLNIDNISNSKHLRKNNTSMASPTPLYGTELVDCARANAKQGIETAAYLCGYGKDINKFAGELRQACEEMNLQVKELSGLITEQDLILELGTGEIIAPKTASEL